MHFCNDNGLEVFWDYIAEPKEHQRTSSVTIQSYNSYCAIVYSIVLYALHLMDLR